MANGDSVFPASLNWAKRPYSVRRGVLLPWREAPRSAIPCSRVGQTLFSKGRWTMPVVRPCVGCSRIFPPAELKRGNCLECRRVLERERAPRKQKAQRDSGRSTAHWERVKAEAKRRANYTCESCGAVEDGDANRWLTCHLHPSLANDHRLATVDYVTVLCQSCHSKLHARTR